MISRSKAKRMSNNTQLFYSIAQSPVGWLFKKVAKPYPKIILAYHGVQKEMHPRCIHPDLFLEHMLLIKKIANVVPVSDYIKILGCDEKRITVSVTFDDAYSNLMEEAIPILVEMDIPATIYVPLKFIGKRNEWDRNRAEPMLPILSRDDLENIINKAKNITIGSHGMNHCRLADLSEKNLHQEIIGSKKGLEDMLGIPIESIAYPHGGRLDYDERTMDVVTTSGYRFALSTRFGRYNRENEKWCLRRVVVWSDDSLERFKAKIQGNYDWICMKECLAFKLRSTCKGLQK